MSEFDPSDRTEVLELVERLLREEFSRSSGSRAVLHTQLQPEQQPQASASVKDRGPTTYDKSRLDMSDSRLGVSQSDIENPAPRLDEVESLEEFFERMGIK